MTSPAQDALRDGDRLLHASAARLLVVTHGEGGRELRKIFLRGSLADAQREVDLGLRLRALPVVHVLAAELDPVTARPCVRMALHPGDDLEQFAALRGALPAPLACAIGAALADALAALHAFTAADLPHGLVHGDIKPANVLWDGGEVRLLDLEHAAPIGSRPAPAGTDGYAPPETATAAAAAAADVYALGVTLRFLLTGGEARHNQLRAHDEDLRELLAYCTADDARLRPTAAAAAATLRAIAARQRDDERQAALQSLLAGDLERAGRILDGLRAGDPERTGELRQLLQRRQRLLARRPQCATIAAAVPAGPQELLQELRHTQSLLRRFPAHEAALRHRAALRSTAGIAIAGCLQQLNDLCREENFSAAQAWLATAIELGTAVQELPGGLRIDTGDDPRLPSPLRQRPLEFLALQQAALARQQRDHQALADEVEAAETRLDLAAAEAAIDRMGALYGGATGAVSRRRDRLHRLGFYLERIARAATNLERLVELQPKADLNSLMVFCADCLARGAHGGRSDPPGGVGLRSLQLTLANLAEEFPALTQRVEPGWHALEEALERTTDQAWELVDKAQQMLAAQPVPVRPLQALFHRLDGYRLLETFVDRPQRPRSQLLDRIESLRLKLEQSRATRDRLARGAEVALAKGHWTTGLFDMERAVEGLDESSDTGEDAEVKRLRDRLAAARRRKQEVESAVRRNMELGARFATLQDDPAATFGQRRQLLRERRDCLQFLAMHVAADRSALYGRDLREVETQLALEAAGEAEMQLDATEDPTERSNIVRATLAQLDEHAQSDQSVEAPGRLQRLLDHWRKLLVAAQRDVDRRRAETLAAERQRRRRRLYAFAGGLALLVGIGIGWQLLGQRAQASSPLQALRAAADNPAAARAADLAAQGANAADVTVWHRDFAAALAADGVTPPFANECWRAGIAAAAAGADAARITALLAAIDAAASNLAARAVVLPDVLVAELRARLK